jgi:hypothetical protein
MRSVLGQISAKGSPRKTTSTGNLAALDDFVPSLRIWKRTQETRPGSPEMGSSLTRLTISSRMKNTSPKALFDQHPTKVSEDM